MINSYNIYFTWYCKLFSFIMTC